MATVMEFYCTAGRGTEFFLEKELRDMFQNNLHQVKVTDGKIFFKLSSNQDEVKKVLELKTAERAFVQVCLIKTSDLDHRNLMYSIKKNLNYKEAWRDSLALLQSARVCLDKGENSAGDGKNKYMCAPEGINEPVCKRPKIDPDDSRKTDVTFRVNFKCPACFRKRLNIKIGMHIKQLMGWRVELRHPLVEICIQLNEEFLTVGLPLTREPLSKRHFIKMIGLRSTVAHIMTELLQIQNLKPVAVVDGGGFGLHDISLVTRRPVFGVCDQTGETVLDPMCGKATILLEAANCHKDIKYIGMDKSDTQLLMARENCQFAKADNIQLIHGDALALPFHNASIEKIVTDAPFGNTHTTDIPLEDFYTKILQEFSRVLTPSGRLVILTSSAMKNFITKITCCAEQTKHSKGFGKDKIEGNNSDTIDFSSELDNEVESKSNQISKNEMDATYCDLIDETVSENANEMTDSKQECENIQRPNEIASNHETLRVENSSQINDRKLKNTEQNSDSCLYTGLKLPRHSSRTEDEMLEKDHVCRAQLDDKNTEIPNNVKNAYETNSLVLLESHYVKLGETHAYICVLERSAVT